MTKSRKAGEELKKAFKKMDKPMSKGGTGGTFTAAATKAGYEAVSYTHLRAHET